MDMDRYWLLTSTTYGTWLPGDERGFVGRIREGAGPRVEHDIPGTTCDKDLPGLKRASQALMRGKPVWFSLEQVQVLAGQFQETAAYRQWCLLATAVMANHVHWVVGVTNDPDPEDLLRDLKSYGSRALNKRWQRPQGGTWWTESGSKRKLSTERSVWDAVVYVVKKQYCPLVTWVAGDYWDHYFPIFGERGASAPRGNNES